MGRAPGTHSRKGLLVMVIACGLVAVAIVAIVAACGGGGAASAQPPFPSYGRPFAWQLQGSAVPAQPGLPDDLTE
jgi:hypothetical protein